MSRSRFFQVLEGRQDNVEKAYARISKDGRHRDLNVVWSGSAAGRLFDGWAMVAPKVSVGDRVNIDRLIDQASGYPHAAIGELHRLVEGRQP